MEGDTDTGDDRAAVAWIRALSPVDPTALSRSVLSGAQVEELTVRLGAGPVGWAVELGVAMTDRIVAEVPELAADGIVEWVRGGCEAVAVEAIGALADEQDFVVSAAPDVLVGPAEIVSRGVGVEHMLRSIHIGHAVAAEYVLDAAERLMPAPQRFATMRRVTEVLFDITDRLTTAMAAEYGQAQRVWQASSAALRAEVIGEILRGEAVDLHRAQRILGYDLTRQHLGLVVWTDHRAAESAARLDDVAASLLTTCGATATLIVPVGGRRVWAWGASTRRPPALPTGSVLGPIPGVRVAVGLPAPGVLGFAATHRQASDAADLGAIATSRRWLFDYGELDLVVMLSARPEQAREFVHRELGDLATPGEFRTAVRTTLKCYLDNERSLAATAAQLRIARNTVAYRVQRAEELRGRKIHDRRTQLQAALALAEELGAAVLDVDTAFLEPDR
ncbi:PucR family transcriptional regulator [Nocardia sp. CA-120079]|uniref:PucR family transcriptional regulator n=1 Tax=Nocardia sp. CA-120079 TaxID=3239974 RepID=UPI003D96CBDD